jgi:tetratricopeptide (TPR) repeat protein
MSDKNITFLINVLKENLNNETDNHQKVYLIIAFCRKHFSVLDDVLYSCILEGIDIASNSNYIPEIYILKSYKIFYLLHYEKRKEALGLCNDIIPSLLKLKFYAEYGLSILVMCIIEWSKGNLETPFLILNKSLNNLKYKRNKKAALAHIYYSFAVFYFDLNELNQAQHFYSLAKKNSDENTEPGLVLYTKIGLASILLKQGEYSESVKLLEETLVLAKDNYLWNTEARAYYELGSVYQLENQFKKAKYYFLESYKIRKKNKAYPTIVSSLVCIAQVCFDQKLYEDSKKYLSQALDICEAKNLTSNLIAVYKLFSSLFEKLKDFKTSLKYFKQFNTLEKEFNNNEINIKNKFFRLNYKSKKEPELEKKTRYLNVINAFAEGFLKTNTVDEIVWMVARQAIGKLGYEDCVVYLFDENKEFLIQKAA